MQPYDLVFTVFHDQVATLPIDELKKIITTQLSQSKATEHAIIGQKEN